MQSDQKSKTTSSNEPLLKSFDIYGVADYIKDGKAKNIIFMTGAGMSCSAGIPDFRSIGTGIYSNLDKYHLENPSDIFTLSYFNKHPEPFFDFVETLLPGNFSPTPSHYFIKLVYQKGLLLRQYTQNIDGLERAVGIPLDRLVEAHGTFFTAHCQKCKQEYSLDSIREDLKKKTVLHCRNEGCDGVVKPDIVFFGESLPSFHPRPDFSKCDLLIIIGTSLKVNPFASLTSYVG